MSRYHTQPLQSIVSQCRSRQKFNIDKLEATSSPATRTNGPNTFKDPLGACTNKGNCTCGFSPTQLRATLIDEMEEKPCESKCDKKKDMRKERKKVQDCRPTTNQKCEVSRSKHKEKKICDQTNNNFPSFEQYCREFQSNFPCSHI